MSTLSCAELAAYPGTTQTDRIRAHHAECNASPSTATTPLALARAPAARRPAPLPRRIDVRRFPGQSRVERVANYLRAHMPRSESWGDEAILDFAARLLATAEVLE